MNGDNDDCQRGIETGPKFTSIKFSMEDDPQLIQLKTDLLNLVGEPHFSTELKNLVLNYLGEELHGYRILSSEGEMNTYHWEPSQQEFIMDSNNCSSVRTSDAVMDLRSIQTDTTPFISAKKDDILATFYRAICYHHLLLAKPEKINLSTPLTKREREVLQEILEGLNNREIAEKLQIHYRTVEKHCENIYRKLGVENRNSLSSLRNPLS